MQACVVAGQAREAAQRKEEELKFLEEHKRQPGVITTESGLQYKIITEGKGPKPEIFNRVHLHYVGKLLDGTVFDSSVARGEAARIYIAQLNIDGWKEALQLMPEGSKFIFWMPSELGFGEVGSGIVPPNSVLIFEIELMDIMMNQ